MKAIIEDVRGRLVGYEMSFKDLDNYMVLDDFNSEIDGDVEDFIKEGRVVYYHEEVQVEIIFEITCEVSKDESIASTYIEIKKVREN